MIIIEPIGIIHSCFTEKFGIPRQPNMVPSAEATVTLLPPFNREEMVRGLEGFSYIWIQFIFHKAIDDGWKPTVRPPRLGGKVRTGIFACRSPHRPNHIGLSAVRLKRIEYATNSVKLHIRGVDLLNNTPVIDIKPYIPYSDCISDAEEGFTAVQDVGNNTINTVAFSNDAEHFCREYQKRHNRPLHQLITEILLQDPRPMVQRGSKTEFAMTLWDINIRWRVEQQTGHHTALVRQCEYKN